MNQTFERNLAAIGYWDAPTAQAIRDAAPLPSLTFHNAKREDACTAVIEIDGAPIALASRYEPKAEAERMVEAAGVESHGVIVVLGLGVAHHIRALIERIKDDGLIIVYEPDPALARAVLEQLDLTDVFGREQVLLFVGPVDEAHLIRRMDPHATMIAHGVGFMAHAPTRRLHDAALSAFAERFAKFVSYCRTNLATSMVISPVTCENLIANIDRYAAGDPIDPLLGWARGFPAVIVSAGPSLARNVHLLQQPGIRDRVVIIAVQTALKPLLDRGIRPHFVTALDYHQISARFYEGLDDLRDVTLIAEPKVHRSIIDRYPGPIRLTQNNFCDLLLADQARSRLGLRDGTTVAHLAFYLAQFLGCDPIIFIGQDLGFSDGLYYCPGTAIHQVWSAELNAFNTLEMMEHKRIVRHRNHLQKHTDVNGRPIYSDEQMTTYLRQFLRDFAAAEQQVIDATEGGMPKEHTTRMTLAEALERYAVQTLPELPMTEANLDSEQLQAVRRVIARRAEEMTELRKATAETMPIIRRMIRDQRDHAKMDKLFARLETRQKRVEQLDEAFQIMNHLNQIGAMKRHITDRAIRMDASIDPYERQRRQLERDVTNLQLILEACDATHELLHRTVEAIERRLNESTQRQAGDRKVAVA